MRLLQSTVLFLSLSFVPSCVKRKAEDPISLAEEKCGQYSKGGGPYDKLVSCLRSLPREDIKQIPEVRDYLAKHPVYVTLTTSPQRLQHISTALETIDEDLVKNIFLTLPEKFKNKEDYPEDQIQKLEKSFPKLIVLRPKQDLGPITKMLPSIEKASKEDPKAIVISMDDDNGYSIGIFGQLIKAIILHPNPSVVGTQGQRASFWTLTSKKKVFANECSNNGRCDVVEGVGAIGYSAGVVPVKQLEDFSQVSKVCRLGDDVVINYGLALAKVERRKIANEYVNGVIPLEFGAQGDALHQQNDYRVSYRQCILDIETAH